jgi:serine/threonine protein kinase
MKLIVESGPVAGLECNLSDVLLVGRCPTNDMVIDDPAMSLLHARLQVAETGVLVTDLGSTNGTWVNASRIVSELLHDGDLLQMGDTRIRVSLTNPQLGDPASKTGLMNLDSTVAANGSIFGSVTYSLNRKIADGGMGAIYEAQQFGAEGFVKRVAIKTILPEFAARENEVAAFVGEARLVANLVHQNIVQIHHFGRHQGGYYIVMEYIDGLTLASFLGIHQQLNRPIPVALATFIVSRIARGLEYAHNRRDTNGEPLHLVHRDVSPGNIMIDKEGEVKLADFGVARAAHFMEDDSDDLVGCLEFMSPEQASCDPVDGRSDIFSLGLVYYELLTGQRPHRAESDGVAMAITHILTCSIPDPRQFRAELSDRTVQTLMTMLNRSPGGRFSSAGELSQALEEEMYSTGYGPTVVKLAAYTESLLADVDLQTPQETESN